MPELPEVETIKRQLAHSLRNEKITAMDIRLPKMIIGSSWLFKKHAVGARVERVERRGKVLIIFLDSGYAVLIHLKMTGQLVYRKKKVMRVGGHPIKDGLKELPNKYTHIVFLFADGSHLYFNDLRRFGYLRLVSVARLPDFFSRLKLGPEPLVASFTIERFRQLLKCRPQAKIKPLLMDQSFIAGVGNIYAAESCFAARVKPTRLAKTLTMAEIHALYRSVRRILRQAIANQGTSSDTYVNAFGEPGKYVSKLKVYGRSGELCRRCHNILKSIKLAGRGTVYCQSCQR